MTQTVIIQCPSCKGRGEIADINWPMALLTLGITALVDSAVPAICGTCHGHGRIKFIYSTDKTGTTP